MYIGFWNLIFESENMVKCCKMHVPKSLEHRQSDTVLRIHNRGARGSQPCWAGQVPLPLINKDL